MKENVLIQLEVLNCVLDFYSVYAIYFLGGDVVGFVFSTMPLYIYNHLRLAYACFITARETR